MASTRGTNTQQEALQGILGEIAQIKTFPDADIEWLLGIETQILQKLREPVQNAINQSDLQGMNSGPQPAPDQMAPGGMGQAPQAPPMAPGVAGLRTSPGAPNPDELRRLLTQGQ